MNFGFWHSWELFSIKYSPHLQKQLITVYWRPKVNEKKREGKSKHIFWSNPIHQPD